MEDNSWHCEGLKDESINPTANADFRSYRIDGMYLQEMLIKQGLILCCPALQLLYGLRVFEKKGQVFRLRCRIVHLGNFEAVQRLVVGKLVDSSGARPL